MKRTSKVLVSLLLSVVVAIAAGCKKENNQGNGGNDQGDLPDDTIVDSHEYVDLGLPSGILWATCNVGATVPEEYGDYFSWGETIPKDIYDWKSYKYGSFVNDRYRLTKYCTDSLFGLNGFVDGLTLMEPVDDAALANWGAGWRIPAIEEWDEMRRNTTCTWTAQNGVNGWRFTASNGNSIFLPAAGYWWGSVFNGSDLGIYWSVSLNTDYPNRAWGFHFSVADCHLCGSSDRNRGQSVRAVRSAK